MGGVWKSVCVGGVCVGSARGEWCSGVCVGSGVCVCGEWSVWGVE